MPARTKTSGLTANQTINFAPIVFSYEIATDATGSPVAFVAPCDMYILDVIVEARATSMGATLSIINAGVTGSGTDAMCTAISCAADGAVTHMSAGADDTKLNLPKNTVVKVDASASDVRALVSFLGIRV